MRKTEVFRQLLKTEKSILMPVAHDALTAKIIEKVGFKAFSLGGFSIAASCLGVPDLSILSSSEMVEAVRNLANAVSIPMLADADTGYGGIFNVARTVKEYENSGATLLFIEDQKFPKRCGHMNGKEVIPAEEMAIKIKAAVSSRQDPDFLIVSRTDARTTHNLKEAIDRSHVYVKAGADIVFIEAPESVEELKIIANEITEVPLLVNMLEGGKTPLLSQKDLGEMGYKLIAWPISSLLVTVNAVTELMTELLKNGTTQGMSSKLAGFSEVKNLLGIDELKKFEEIVTGRDSSKLY